MWVGTHHAGIYIPKDVLGTRLNTSKGIVSGRRDDDVNVR